MLMVGTGLPFTATSLITSRSASCCDLSNATPRFGTGGEGISQKSICRQNCPQLKLAHKAKYLQAKLAFAS